MIKLKRMEMDFSVCKVKDSSLIDLEKEFCFAAKTDEEISLVCMTGDVPEETIVREDGWNAFRIEGILDFSLVGILAGISGLLADNDISIFAVSTYQTDYILVKSEQFERALNLLAQAGYEII